MGSFLSSFTFSFLTNFPPQHPKWSETGCVVQHRWDLRSKVRLIQIRMTKTWINSGSYYKTTHYHYIIKLISVLGCITFEIHDGKQICYAILLKSPWPIFANYSNALWNFFKLIPCSGLSEERLYRPSSSYSEDFCQSFIALHFFLSHRTFIFKAMTKI